MTPSPVRTAAQEMGLTVYTPATLKDDEFWNVFDALRPDVCVVVAYGKLLPQRYLDVPRLGFVNVHPSLLPAYRGPSPIQSAILDGCSATGVSIMLLDDQMDHGPVLASVPWVIPGGFDASLCEDELSRVGADLLADALASYAQGEITPVPQQHELATYCSKFVRADGRLDWHQSSDAVVNRIRALSANPGSWTTWEQKTVNIFHAHVFDAPVPAADPGTVMLVGTDLVVCCTQGAVALEVIQLEGSTRQHVRDFLNGHPSFADGMLT